MVDHKESFSSFYLVNSLIHIMVCLNIPRKTLTPFISVPCLHLSITHMTGKTCRPKNMFK